jgi:Response regulator containing a CheY-like receiver domain and an HD-GYP domain
LKPSVHQRVASLRKALTATSLLQVFVIALVIGLIALYSDTSRRYSAYQESIREDALWHVTQLDRAARGLYTDVVIAQLSDSVETDMLQEISSDFDVMYSQLSVVLQSSFGSHFLADKVAIEIDQVKKWVEESVPLFDRISEGYRPTPAELATMRSEVERLFQSTSELLSLTVGRVHASRSDARETIMQAQMRAVSIIGALVASAAVLVIMLKRQLSSVRQASREMEAIAEELRDANGKLSNKADWLRSEVDNALAEVRKRDVEIVDRLSLAAGYKDSELGSHTRRVGAYSEAIARNMGLDPDYCADIRLASPMHDIGKVAIPDQVLQKVGPLTEDEFSAMKRHTTVGGQILSESESPLLQLAAEIALGHHEHWNGRGYPSNASGSSIPLSARIVAVADTFDALTTIRPYKVAWPRDRAIDYIFERAGDQFDPECVDGFRKALPEILRIMDEEKIAVA